MLRRSIILYLVICWTLVVHGQAYLAPGSPKGGGSFSTCDPTLQLDFTVAPMGDLFQFMDAEVDAGNTVVGALHWAFVDAEELMQAEGDTATVQFSAPGETAVCLAAFALDMVTQQPCTTAVCKFIEIVPDSSCLQLQPDFSIASINDNTISFIDNSPFVGGSMAVWNYGDAVSSTTEAQHTFTGPGPHQVCLTLVGPGSCSSTICKWLYLGPGNVDCNTVLQPGFLHYFDENFVVVLDTSLTTGQSTETSWDFGDGSTGTGRIAVHFYDFEAAYQVCANVQAWGPLAADTCTASACDWVSPAVTTLEERPMDGISIAPNPADVLISIDGIPDHPAHLEIRSMDGRLVRSLRLERASSIAIDELPGGTYVIRIINGSVNYTGRFVKL